MAVEKGSYTVKKGLAQMLKGGVIMDVVTPEQAKIAEEDGACAAMALQRGPAASEPTAPCAPPMMDRTSARRQSAWTRL